MVVKPAVLVVGDDEEELVPLGARPQGLVHLLHKPLALGHVVGRVVVVAGEELGVEVPLLHHHVVGQLPFLAVLVEGEVEVMEVAYVLEIP